MFMSWDMSSAEPNTHAGVLASRLFNTKVCSRPDLRRSAALSTELCRMTTLIERVYCALMHWIVGLNIHIKYAEVLVEWWTICHSMSWYCQDGSRDCYATSCREMPAMRNPRAKCSEPSSLHESWRREIMIHSHSSLTKTAYIYAI